MKPFPSSSIMYFIYEFSFYAFYYVFYLLVLFLLLLLCILSMNSISAPSIIISFMNSLSAPSIMHFIYALQLCSFYDVFYLLIIILFLPLCILSMNYNPAPSVMHFIYESILPTVLLLALNSFKPERVEKHSRKIRIVLRCPSEAETHFS